MKCLYCANDTRVINSRRQKRNNQVWRRRQCQNCKAVFTSLEVVDLPSSLIVDLGSRSQPFLPDKLYTEVLLALQDRRDCYEAAREVTGTVIKEVLKLPERPLILSRQISQAAAKVLKRFDRRAYLRYVAEHPSLQE